MAGPGRPAKSVPTTYQEIESAFEGTLTEEIKAEEPILEKAPTIDLTSLVESQPSVNLKKGNKYTPPESTFVQFEMVGHFPRDEQNGTIRYPKLSINNTHIIWDPEKKSFRQARYLKGFSSIWLEDQEDIDPKRAASLRPDLYFNEGQLIVQKSDENLIKFLMGRSDFEGCEYPSESLPKRYRVINMDKEDKLKYEKSLMKKKASDLAWSAEEEHMLVHGKYLGIQLLNEKGLPKGFKSILADYVDKAESNPELFIKSFNDPIVKTYSLIRDAMEASKIIFVDNQAIWAETKTTICVIPMGQHGPEFLAKMMLTPQGKELYERLNAHFKIMG